MLSGEDGMESSRPVTINPLGRSALALEAGSFHVSSLRPPHIPPLGHQMAELANLAAVEESEEDRDTEAEKEIPDTHCTRHIPSGMDLSRVLLGEGHRRKEGHFWEG